MITTDLTNQTVFMDPMVSAEFQTVFWAAVDFVLSFVGMVFA